MRTRVFLNLGLAEKISIILGLVLFSKCAIVVSNPNQNKKSSSISTAQSETNNSNNSSSGNEKLYLASMASDGTIGLNNSTVDTQRTSTWSGTHTISSDGDVIVFESTASNLVSGDTNGVSDIFVHTRSTGITERVSVNSAGVQGDAASSNPSISSDGRFVAFTSLATNFESLADSYIYHVYLHDRNTGSTILVSLDQSSTQFDNNCYYPVISGDGNVVVFETLYTPTGKNTIFARDINSSTTRIVSADSSATPGNGFSSDASVNYNGSLVAFMSGSTNLVPGDSLNDYKIFLKNLITGAVEMVSVSSSEVAPNSSSITPSISSDGNLITFTSLATNLVASDSNGVRDIFLRNVSAGTTVRISTDSSDNQANGASYVSSISADGAYVAFQSIASNLVTDDTNGYYDIFLKNLSTGDIVNVSRNSAGTLANEHSFSPGISSDGQFVSFMSNASNLVSSANAKFQMFIFDRDALFEP